MKSFLQDSSEKKMLRRIKETLDNLQDIKMSNTLKAEAILNNLKLAFEVRPESSKETSK